MTESTADVFAAYLGMTPENAGWAWKKLWLPTGQYGHHEQRFTATSPLAPAPTPGWLERLVAQENVDFVANSTPELVLFARRSYRCQAGRVKDGARVFGDGKHPTHAVARALIAADPALRARLEACQDWSDYNTPTPGKEDE